MLLGLVLLFTSAQDSSALVRGQVTLKGERPAPKKIQSADESALKAYPEGAPYVPIPVDPDGHMRFVLVWVKAGLEGHSAAAPKEPKAIELENFQMRPRILGILAGQDLTILNRDRTGHDIHALPRRKENHEFHTPVEGGSTLKATFAKPEVAVGLGCERHPWERAWVAVMPHPFFAVTDERGHYEIPGLPPGKYTLEAWQENSVALTQDIELKAKEPKTVDFVLEERGCAHLFISGRVQGVGFRASTEEEAKRIGGLTGWVKNLADGRVEAVIQGAREKVEKLVRWCQKGPPTAHVQRVDREEVMFDDELKAFEARY